MAQIAEWTCSICEKPNGKYVCYDCNQFLCDCCKNIHNKFPANKLHTVVEAHLKVLPVSHECEKHKKNFLHYCQTCECLTCSECITSDHNGHAFRHVKDIADNARKIVSEAICNLKQNQSTMTNMNEEIRIIEMSKIQSDTEKFTSKVSHLSQCLKEIIETVVKKQETFAFDFLALGKAQLESYLAKLNKAFEDYSSLCKLLENVLLETHDATFYVNQSKLMKELNMLEIIPPIEKVDDLKEFSDEDFIDNVVNKIQVQHGIRAIQRKNIQKQTLSDQLKQEEILHQETKKSLVTEREKMESAIQSKDILMEKLSRRMKQEEIGHQKTKTTIISEKKKFETEIQGKEMQMRGLSELLKQVEEDHKETVESIITERNRLVMKLESAFETLSKRMKEEEIRNQKLKELVIAERTKHGTNLTLILFGLSWCGKSATENGSLVRKFFWMFHSDAFEQQCSDIYQGVTINIFECSDSIDYESYLNYMYYRKLTTKQDVVFLFNFTATGNCTPDLIQRFDGFLKLSKQRNANMVAVFTRHAEMKLFNQLNDNRDDEKIHKDQWLIKFSKTLSSKVQENNIKCMVIEDGHSFELTGNRNELLNLCGLNTL